MDYVKYAQDEIKNGKNIDEIALYIKNNVKEQSLIDGVNEQQAELFSVSYTENVFKQFEYLEERSKYPKSLSDEELDKLEIKPIEFKKDACNSCDFIKSKDSVLKRCDICHCLLEFKWRIESSHCPIGKW